MGNWQVVYVKEGDEAELLEQGWEPFAVTFRPGYRQNIGGGYESTVAGQHFLWLRRQVTPSSKGGDDA